MCSTDADDESTEAIAAGGESTAACCMMTVAAGTGGAAAAAAFVVCFFDITLFALLLVYTVVALLIIPHLGGGRCSYSIFFISPIVTRIMIVLLLCHSSLLSMHLMVVRFILKAIVVKFNRPFISSDFDLDTAKFGRRQ